MTPSRRSSRRDLATLLRRVEAMNIHTTERHWRLIPIRLAERARPRVLQVGDGLLTLLTGSDSLRLNRVIGLGHRGRAEEAMIDEITGRCREARIKRFSVMVGPGPQSGEIEEWLSRRGFEARLGHALLLRDLSQPIARPNTALRVARAGGRQRETVAQVLAESFPVPESRREWSLAAAGARHNQSFLAYAGRGAVAVAILCVLDGLAWLGGASTRTRWRRRGAQSALIAARLRRASRLGCRWAWSETAAPGPGRPAGSRRNLMRMGFEPVCLKPLYVCQVR